MVHIPRIIIAGVHSNCGKTTVARGLMAALVRRGLTVQPFKIGPDFIDPSHHTRICGRVSRNLDPIIMGESEVISTFVRASQGADIAIIEGVMGMFDGVDGTQEGSSAHVSKILDAPVILVIPVKGMSGSVHAIAEGFSRYDPEVHLTGVILNMVGSQKHRTLLQVGKTIEQLGFIPCCDDLHIGSRHLGLYMAEEAEIPIELAKVIEENCDVEEIISHAQSVKPLPDERYTSEKKSCTARIAIAADPAFCFYYQENLDRLREAGGELIFFSPMNDELPETDLIYLGGGYPELYADELAQGPALKDIKRSGDDGMPVYAECGGLMYLGRGLSGDGEEKSTRWAGLLPVEACMEKRFQALGYTIGTFHAGPSVFTPGAAIRGHEFHYSRLIPDRDARFAITLTKGTGIANGQDGVYTNNCMGAYTHAYFSCTNAEDLIRAALAYKKQ